MRLLLALALLASGCGPGSSKPGDSGEPTAWHLEVTTTLPEALTSGGTARVGLRIVDEAGAVATDAELGVEVTADGNVVASGVTAAGLVELDVPLTGCATPTLTAAADGLAAVTVGTLAVAPALRVVEAPGPLAPAGELPPLGLTVLDADGSGDAVEGFPLTLTGAGATAALDAEVTADVADGEAWFDGLTATGEGPLTLTVRGPEGCPIDAPVASVVLADDASFEPVFLPAARVGRDYAATLPGEVDAVGILPGGLAWSGAWVLGVPEAAEAASFDAVRWDGAAAHRYTVRLPVLPASDTELALPAFAPSAPGPYPTDAVELQIPTLTVSTGTYRNVAVRVAFPSDGAGGVAAGRFPLVAFHHAAHGPSDIYDAYTDLHGHWASHGVIVASVDSHVNVDGQSQSWTNLSDMSVFQRGAVELLRAADGDPGSPLHGHVDGERVVVSGHSRGGGASLVSLWRDPTLLGAICFEPVSPLQTAGQDWGNADENADRALPTRPILIFVGAEDRDEPWPLPDVSYEQTVGPAALVTIHGANHEDTYDAGTPGGTTSTSTIPVTVRHDVDQHYSTAFLYRFGGAGAAGGDLAWDAALFGPDAAVQPLTDEGVSVHGRRYVASAATIDAFQGATEENEWGGANVSDLTTTDANDEPYAQGLAAVGRYDERGERIGVWARARHLAWEDPDAELALFLDPAGAPVDVQERDVLVVRVERDCPPPDRGSCPDVDVDLELAVWDADGGEAGVSIGDRLGDRGIMGRHWGTARVALDELAGVDLTRAEGVALRLGARGWEDGDVWVDDLRLE